MNFNSIRFFMTYDIEDTQWRVDCSVTNPEPDMADDDVNVVQIICAENEGVSLDERAWRALLEEHELVEDFCDKLLSNVAFMEWTMSKTVGHA